MAKFKVGDMVRLREGLVVGESYGDLCFLEYMGEWDKPIARIARISESGCCSIDVAPFFYSPEMLCKTTPTFPEIRQYKLSCIICCHSVEQAEKIDIWCADSTMPNFARGAWRNHDLPKYVDGVCYRIEDGIIAGFDGKEFYEGDADYDTYPIYDFADIACDAEPTDLNRQRVTMAIRSLAAKLAETNIGFTPTGGNNMKSVFNKNSLKFTTTKGVRYSKTGEKIPTITTTVYNDGTGLMASATCDEADYNERQGILEALGNMAYVDFDKAYRKELRRQARVDREHRTCPMCGKVFDTAEERAEHEAWHVERKKARHERYLLRKRAKEIAFEQRAQEMAKEILAEDKK